ncbi:MAG: hypothetical protein Q7K44_04200 [Candidatus Liptonbacteria bacterium]|nr:hypothetical protein [Candidatus Liptonbacteria bacterium]
MNFSLTYLIGRFIYRIIDFFHHWYTDASRVFFYKLISFLEELDQTLALRMTLRYFFQPLYKDYTFIGRILGVVFRTCRAFIGFVVYVFVLIIFLASYVLWLAAPIILIIYIFNAK